MGYFLVFKADSTINNTYNRRSDSLKEKVLRGSIFSADGDVLAYTETDDEGNETRVYPYGETFAHVVGYESNGGLGIESAYNYYMLTSNANIFERIANEFKGEKNEGNSLITTLDVELQQEIEDILGSAEGAAVVLDPETGEVLAMYSNPGFDPNEIDDIWDTITEDPENSVLVNRATQSTLTPGSTFKIFTLLEYYRENNGNVSSYSYDCTGSITMSDQTIRCANSTSHGTVDIIEAFAQSCNSAFVDLGTTLDPDLFAENNTALLFNSELPLDIAYKQSSFTLDSTSDTALVMQTVFGQGETLISPIHLAMITSAIANDGVLMNVHLVSEVINDAGNTVEKFDAEEYGSLMTEDEAAFLKECMAEVVQSGTASIMASSDYTAYGKTGTAETGSYERSWFTGFAEKDGETVVVCVMIENRSTAGTTGVKAAKQIFDHYFSD